MLNLVLGFIIAFLLAALPGKVAIGWLQKLGAKQNISTDAPTTHSAKQGTPTMGGLLILFALTVTVLGYFLLTQLGSPRRPEQDFLLLPLLLMTLAFGAIGFLDDLLSAKRGRNLGLKAREKFAAQCLVACGFVFWLAKTAKPGLTTFLDVNPPSLLQPFVQDLGNSYYLFAILFIVSFSNATNITDGLDGLSSGLTLLMCITLSALVAALYPALAFFMLALGGSVAGFLWWNAHPAKVFMGDTASLALGAALTGVAILGKQEVGLIIASLVCWAELFSVMIQVTVFKWRKKRHGIEYARAHRVFRRTPLHHHFEEMGWPETQVVQRFWLAGALSAALAMLWSRG